MTPDFLPVTPNVPINAYRNIFGNWCRRFKMPAGRDAVAISTTFGPNTLAGFTVVCEEVDKPS